MHERDGNRYDISVAEDVGLPLWDVYEDEEGLTIRTVSGAYHLVHLGHEYIVNLEREVTPYCHHLDDIWCDGLQIVNHTFVEELPVYEVDLSPHGRMCARHINVDGVLYQTEISPHTGIAVIAGHPRIVSPVLVGFERNMRKPIYHTSRTGQDVSLPGVALVGRYPRPALDTTDTVEMIQNVLQQLN